MTEVDDETRQIIATSRAAQGLPPTIEDPAILERAAAVFRAVGEQIEAQTAPAPRRRRGRTRRGPPG